MLAVASACAGGDAQVGDVPQTTSPASSSVLSPSVPATSISPELITLLDGVDSTGPGCTAAASIDGEVVWADAAGMADLDRRDAMTTETVVDIGSTSKQFTATAIALLIQSGDVTPETPVASLLPQLPAWAGQVRVIDLVHHQSGIPDYIGLLAAEGVTEQDRTTVDQALDVLRRVTQLDAAPGTSFAYSNSNYFLLAEIVRAVTGDDLGSFLAARVFEPLALDAQMDPVADIPGKARSYTRGSGDTWINADSPWEQLGDGAVQTTPSELVRWASEYWSPRVGGPGINDLRLDGAVDDPDLGGRYGFGISVLTHEGSTVLTHGGGWGGFVTSFAVDPARRTALAITCTAPEVMGDLLTSATSDLDLLALVGQ
jgi:CubicO group peptidase (beta-lactamase class C family)